MFRVYDYTNATRLLGKDFVTRPTPPSRPREPGPEPPPPIEVEGFDVQISDAGRYIVTTIDGKTVPVTVEEYKERLGARLVEEAPSLDDFRRCWVVPHDRRELLERLPDGAR